MSNDAFGQKKDAFAVVQPKAPESPRESLRDSQSQSEDPPALQAEHLPDQSSQDTGDPLNQYYESFNSSSEPVAAPEAGAPAESSENSDANSQPLSPADFRSEEEPAAPEACPFDQPLPDDG